ncbi:MAG: hypothetical protein D3922_10155 [Candidatus Electrothrix sp. AR1]|nr:hypothetical protein [Candidatus Electrothrix sp. AR1]
MLAITVSEINKKMYCQSGQMCSGMTALAGFCSVDARFRHFNQMFSLYILTGAVVDRILCSLLFSHDL